MKICISLSNLLTGFTHVKRSWSQTLTPVIPLLCFSQLRETALLSSRALLVLVEPHSLTTTTADQQTDICCVTSPLSLSLYSTLVMLLIERRPTCCCLRTASVYFLPAGMSQKTTNDGIFSTFCSNITSLLNFPLGFCC